MGGFSPLTDSETGRASSWGATDGAAHVVPQNITTKFRDAFEAYDPLNGGVWREHDATGDLIFTDGNAAAASYLVISKDPLSAGTESNITTTEKLTLPVEAAVGLSMSQRTLGQEFSMEVVDAGDLIEDTSELLIDSITQATTTLTVNTVLPHGYPVGRAIGVRALADSRINYPALVVASVPSPTQFTATAGPGGTIPSLSAYTTSVLAATTAALPANTYANGTLGVGATLTANTNGAFPAQDGVTVLLNQRVLVKNEAAPANNGVYVLTQVGNAGLPWILTRATDFDTTAEMTVVAGALFAVNVYVQQGTTQAQRQFYLTATVTTVGTTAVTFADTTLVGQLGFVYVRQRLGRARNGVSQIFENVTVTNASLYIRSEAGDALPSGTIVGNNSVTVGTTASIQLVNAAYTYAFSPTNEYRLLIQADRTQWADSVVDATAQMTSRAVRTQVCPDPSEKYRLRFRATNNRSLTVPNAQIVSAVKSGTTTANIVTDRPHGYVPGEIVVVYGIRAQGATEFPNLTTATPVASVVSPTEFTIVIGAAGTVTSYGGYVAKVQGGNLMSALGASAVVAQSAVLSTLADGTRQLVITGNTTWAAGAIGDLVNVVGMRADLTGVSLGVDGPWKIANQATTVLTLVLPFSGQRVLPADFGSANCGGAIIKRTCLRVSFVRIFDYERLRVEALARPASDAASAMPVSIQNTVTTTFTQPALVAGTALVGDVGVQYRATAAGLATTTTHFVAAGSTNATLVKNAAGKVFGWYFANTTASWRYVKLHNQATAPTAGTGVVRTIGIPPNNTASFFSEGGVSFTAGIGLTMVTGAADTDATAVTANDIVGELFYA